MTVSVHAIASWHMELVGALESIAEGRESPAGFAADTLDRIRRDLIGRSQKRHDINVAYRLLPLFTIGGIVGFFGVFYVGIRIMGGPWPDGSPDIPAALTVSLVAGAVFLAACLFVGKWIGDRRLARIRGERP
jgi:hypothetical protein